MAVINHRLLAAFAAAAITLSAKSKPRQDEITVDAHLATTGAPVTRFLITSHKNRPYVYAEHEQGKGATLIDLSKSSAPQVLGEVADTGLYTVAGTAALATSTTAPPAAPQTIRIMDLSDPTHPKVTRQFEGVTAIEKIPGRHLILLANSQGIWILSEHLTADPDEERRYANKVIYGESMY